MILAATAPLVMKSTNAPSEAPWKYVTLGDLAQNAAVYTVLGGSAVSVFGDKYVPLDSSVTENKAHVFAAKLNPKISVVARNHSFNPLISRHLIDFYEKATSGNDVTNIGKISFDNYYNLAIGKNALDNIEPESIMNHSDAANESNTLWTDIKSSNDTDVKAALNTAVGQYAMGGDRKNVAYGGSSSSEYPQRNMSGSGNTAVGGFALRRNTIGDWNTAVGAYALESASDTDTGQGSHNTAVGSTALRRNTTGYNNTAIGYSSLKNNISGIYNVAIGYAAMNWNTDNNYNTAIGSYSLKFNVGDKNTAVGYDSLKGIESENNNTCTGNNNTAVGYQALSSNTTGNYNTASGTNALKSNTTGSYNTADGTESLNSNTTGFYNTAVGYQALSSNTTGMNNVAIGYATLKKNTTGNHNIAVGFQTLVDNTEGFTNTAIGFSSLRRNTTGMYNTAIGNDVLSSNTTGKYNIAVGAYSLSLSKTAGYNIAIGKYALRSLPESTGEHNIAVGRESLYANSTGEHNVSIGNYSLHSNSTGKNNTAIGDYALNSNTTGDNNTAIGYNAAGNLNQSNKLYISANLDWVGTSALIYGDDTSGNRKLLFNVTSKQAYLGSIAAANKIITQGELTASLDEGMQSTRLALSDRRLKNITGDNKSGLKEILQLKVKNFTMKNDKNKEPLVGVIAQELQKVFPNSVVKGDDGYLRIKKDEIFYACVNAIKELHALVSDIFAKIAGLDEKIRFLEEKNKLNEEKIKKLETRLEQQNKMFEKRLAELEKAKN